eukprot:CAMPEP_0182442106 /NCGR_PEP_ID=MMETSP1172-20130603/1071_1 /TAXON_ID=708627 /ORGANISM="Timspurckia oligopyrenoides, Strain CCMP3278" /LENGTH=218 /DNA_ID=CAMNT_0024636809 /DNA_START=152 /DNA_END=808 /DNA_ORIENTATION=+
MTNNTLNTVTQSSSPILLFDVMDTVVRDPFFIDMHSHFGFETFEEFLHAKHPKTWVEFELGHISEDDVAKLFFKDPNAKPIDILALKNYLVSSYQFIDEMDSLLHELHNKSIQMHAFSNYTQWYTLIEQKLHLSDVLPWTFVSCNTGLRKPSVDSFEHCCKTLNVDAAQLILIDDRESNCSAAKNAGFLDAIQFKDPTLLRFQLQKYFECLDNEHEQR